MSQTALQANAAFSSAQRAYDDQLPEDDLDFLDTPEGEDFEREEEEALMLTGAGRAIEPEQLWKALNRRREFRAIRDDVINELMKTDSYKQEARRLIEADAERRNEP
jgi:hypothetical protein